MLWLNEAPIPLMKLRCALAGLEVFDMRAIGLRLGLDGEMTPKWFQLWRLASAAATNNESAVNRGVLWTETFYIVGVL